MDDKQLAEIEARAKAAAQLDGPDYGQDILDLIAHIRELEDQIDIMSAERRHLDESWAELEAQKVADG